MNDQSITVCRLHGVYCMHARAGMCKQISLYEKSACETIEASLVGSSMMFNLQHSIPYMHSLALTRTNDISTRCLVLVTTSNIPCSTTLLLTALLQVCQLKYLVCRIESVVSGEWSV